MFLRAHLLDLASRIGARVAAGRTVRLTAPTARLIESVLRAQASAGEGGPALPITVEVWSADGTRLEETVATTLNVAIGAGAWWAAIAARPGARVRLRHGTQILRDSREDAAGAA